MKLRFGAVAVLGAAMFVGGCASSGETRTSDESMLDMSEFEEEMPQWVQDLPVGIEPRDNEHTAQATLFLVQANSASSEEQAQSRYQEALGHAEAGIAADPENPQSYLQAGEALLGLDRVEEGLERLDRAEELHPPYQLQTLVFRENLWLEAYNEGAQLMEAEDLEGAAAAFERANGVYTLRPEAALNLGTVNARLERYAEAAEAFGLVVEIVDGPWLDRVDDETRAEWIGYRQPALTNRAQLLLGLGEYDAAAEAYGKLVEEDPENLDYLTAYASALVAGGRGADAQDLFDDLLNREGLDASDYFTIGVGLYQVEQYDGAAQAFEMAREVVPNHRDLVFNLAQTLYIMESWEALEAVTQELMEVDELNALTYTFRANALLQLGREDEAMAIYTTGEELPIVMDEVQLQAAGSDLVMVGRLSNHGADAGTEVRLAFTFYDALGAELGTTNTTVTFESQGEAREFQATVPDGDVFGYSYRVVR